MSEPKEPGWYWARFRISTDLLEEAREIVHVHVSGWAEHPLQVYRAGHKSEFFLSSFQDWSERIKESGPVYLDRPPVCECCGRKVRETAIRPLMSQAVSACRDCVLVWYDSGETDPHKLKELVWKLHGEFGGEADLSKGPRVIVKETE